MKTTCTFFVFSLLFFLSCGSVSGEARSKIGISVPLSGSSSSFGQDVRDTALYALKHFLGGRYDLVIEDDRCSGKDAVTVAHKLAEVDKVNFVIGGCSAAVLSALPVYKSAGIPLFAPLATSPRISRALGDVYRIMPSDSVSARALYDYISSRHKTLGVLTEQSDYPVDFYSQFEGDNVSKGVVLNNENFISTEADFKSILTRFRSAGIEALFINSNTEQSFALILKQARALKMNVPVYGAFLPGSAEFLKLAGADADGIVFVDYPQNADALTAPGKELYEMFVKEFGAPRSWEMAFASTFESMRLIDAATKGKGKTEETLTSQTFEGLFGPYTIDRNGEVAGLHPVIRKIDGGKVVPAQPTPATTPTPALPPMAPLPGHAH